MMVASASLFLTACATDRAKLGDAYVAKVKIDAAKEATAAAEKIVQEARRIPLLPSECRSHWHSGIMLHDRLDTANVKADGALGGANRQIDKCAAWWDEIRKSREPK
jgi:hypothetical protein